MTEESNGKTTPEAEPDAEAPELTGLAPYKANEIQKKDKVSDVTTKERKK